MQREDYIKKQIDQLGRALGKVLADLLGLGRDSGELSLNQELNTELKDLLEFDIQELMLAPSEQLIETLRNINGMNGENLEKVADIMFALGVSKKHEELRNQILLKCKAIYEFVDRSEAMFSITRNEKVRQIEILLGN